MKLKHGLHLAYCTNVHPGESWAETFAALKRWTLGVKEGLRCKAEYAIGLRLSDLASRQLSDKEQLLEFQRWLEKHGCYVFTINGFPYGQFHGTRVKEQVYAPDWTSPDRVAYTNRLFDLLLTILPAGIEGSVSTLPGSFKEFIKDPAQVQLIRDHLWETVEHIAQLSEASGRLLHLGLEPEPLGLFENSAETVAFFDRLRDQHPGDPRLDRHLGVNYDTCHFAIEFEEPAAAVSCLRSHEIRLSKIHLSNALQLPPTAAGRRRLAGFADDVYLHQVTARQQDGSLRRWKDLPLALKAAQDPGTAAGEEWRVHFHVPLHFQGTSEFGTTSGHALGLMDLLKAEPKLCSHLEMETYTWAVLPEELKSRDVSEQLVEEYRWTLAHLGKRGLAEPLTVA